MKKRKLPKPIKSKALLSVLRGIVDGTRTTIKIVKRVRKAKIKGISKPRKGKSK